MACQYLFLVFVQWISFACRPNWLLQKHMYSRAAMHLKRPYAFGSCRPSYSYTNLALVGSWSDHLHEIMNIVNRSFNLQYKYYYGGTSHC